MYSISHERELEEVGLEGLQKEEGIFERELFLISFFSVNCDGFLHYHG